MHKKCGSRIVIFPNYAAKRNKATTLLETSHPLLLDALTAAFPAVSVAAVLGMLEGPGGYRVVTNPNVHFVSLGDVGNNRRSLAKLYDYLRMLRKIWLTVYRNSFCYIFSPGHVGLLVCISCLLQRQPYALYLRGEWRLATPSILRWIVPIIIRHARFVLCTGTIISKQITSLNSKCEAVVPMSALLLKDVHPRTSYAIVNRCRLLFVGQLAREKGVYELINAVGLLKNEGILNIDLSIVGSGSEISRLQSYIDKLGLGDCILCHGIINDTDRLAALYAEHDIFCLPTYSEGFPRVIYEAMLFSMPIITTRVGQIGTLVQDNVNGFFVKVRCAESLAQKIRLLLENEELRKRLGQQARATVESMVNRWRGSSHGHQVVRWMKQEIVGN